MLVKLVLTVAQLKVKPKMSAPFVTPVSSVYTEDRPLPVLLVQQVTTVVWVLKTLTKTGVQLDLNVFQDLSLLWLV